MNPQDFAWSEDQQVTVTNPTGEPYDFQVHGKAYQVGPGKTVKMAGYIAWVYVYNMASRLCQDADEWNRWNEENFRQQYYDKVVIGQDELIQAVEVQEDPAAVETFEEDAAPAAGSGGNYTPKATSGSRSTKV
jgi:hypothetical protein